MLTQKEMLLNSICGLLFLGSSLLSFTAMKYVSHPIKIIVSSAKILIGMHILF